MKYVSNKAIIFLACTLAGCATGQHPTNNQSVFNSDYGQCEYEATRSTPLTGHESVIALALSRVDLINKCMGNRGYYKSSNQAKNNSSSNNNPDMPVQLNDSLKRIEEEFKQNCLKLEYQEYYSKTGCLTGDINMEHMVDTSKITSPQKAVMLQARGLADQSNKEKVQIIRELGGVKGSQYGDLYDSTVVTRNDRNNIDLYNGRVTWGEYNQRRKEIISEFIETINKLGLNQ